MKALFRLIIYLSAILILTINVDAWELKYKIKNDFLYDNNDTLITSLPANIKIKSVYIDKHLYLITHKNGILKIDKGNIIQLAPDNIKYRHTNGIEN